MPEPAGKKRHYTLLGKKHISTKTDAELAEIRERYKEYKDKRFKGSFKVYELQGEGTRTRLKEYTVEVNGYVNDGVGKGRASCKKPYISWPVTIE